ncbi:MAG: hypothetical protein ABEJ04_04970 [Halobacteriaceae archaeon]
MDVCWNCGEWTPGKEVEDRDEYAVATCPDCGHEHPFRYLPLLVVTGPSGAGKSTVLRELHSRAVTGGDPDVTDRLVPLESDTLWTAGADMETEAYMDLWLAQCREVHQSGRSVLLFGAGMNPENVEPPVHRRYFPAVHYLALVAADDDLAERLGARPDWRESSSEEAVREHVEYNRALKEGEFVPEGVPFETLNTTPLSVAETIEATVAWADDALARY